MTSPDTAEYAAVVPVLDRLEVLTRAVLARLIEDGRFPAREVRAE